MDDGRELGARLASRDDEALAEAYAVYAPGVLAYAARFVGAEDAEDVVQRTFLEAWRSASRYDPRQRFSSWLFTIAHHRSVDALRSRRHTVVDVEAARDLVGVDGREIAEQHAEAADLRSTLRRLPEHERTVLELTYFGQLTQREVAEHLGVPVGTVKARAHRGVQRLGALLRDQAQSDVAHQAGARR